MARASEYLVEGYTYHLTHRCHNRKFLLRFVRDREVYREWLREGVRRYRVPIYGYCVTCNHVHLIVHASKAEAVSDLMHLAAGATAKQYNKRKGHLGSLWEHPYQCTVIETGQHLLNCLCYVDLNMVRAGMVRHPREWRWCGYDELTGARKRYRLVDQERLLESLEIGAISDFREYYEAEIEERIIKSRLTREPCWTESLAVGSKSFVSRISQNYGQRRIFDYIELPGLQSKTWVLKEEAATAYSPFFGAKKCL
jgi:putative transposase